jgi:hypothetical protein
MCRKINLDLKGRFEILTAVSMKMAVFCTVAPCTLVEVYRRFRGACCLHQHGYPYYGDSTHLWNVGKTSTRLHGANNSEDSHLLRLKSLNLQIIQKFFYSFWTNIITVHNGIRHTGIKHFHFGQWESTSEITDSAFNRLNEYITFPKKMFQIAVSDLKTFLSKSNIVTRVHTFLQA